MKNKINIGQRLILGKTKYNSINTHVEVISAGRKYFHVKEYPSKRFFIDSLLEDSNNYPLKCYYSIDDIMREEELNKITNELNVFFRTFNWDKKLSFDQLKRINSIIKER